MDCCIPSINRSSVDNIVVCVSNNSWGIQKTELFDLTSPNIPVDITETYKTLFKAKCRNFN